MINRASTQDSQSFIRILNELYASNYVHPIRKEYVKKLQKIYVLR